MQACVLCDGVPIVLRKDVEAAGENAGSGVVCRHCGHWCKNAKKRNAHEAKCPFRPSCRTRKGRGGGCVLRRTDELCALCHKSLRWLKEDGQTPPNLASRMGEHYREDHGFSDPCDDGPRRPKIDEKIPRVRSEGELELFWERAVDLPGRVAPAPPTGV